jgi:hypothetical protein
LAVVTEVAAPEAVHPDRFPASKPPFVMEVAARAAGANATTGSRAAQQISASRRPVRERKGVGIKFSSRL